MADDGASRLGTNRRCRGLRWLLVAIAVSLAGASAAGWYGTVLLTGKWEAQGKVPGRSIQARAWLDAHRSRYRAALKALDELPVLARRPGPDGSEALVELWRSASSGNFSGFSKLSRFGTTAADSGRTAELVTLARRHLASAMRAPRVDGAPAPFAVAAREVETLGRLTLTSNIDGVRFFKAVNRETAAARALGRDGGFVPALDDATIAMVEAVWDLSLAFTSPAATDDDFGTLTNTRSILGCGVATTDTRYLSAFLDQAIVNRRAAFSLSGCGERQSISPVCTDISGIDCLMIWFSKLPPWRGVVRDGEYRFDDRVDQRLALLPPLE